MRVIKKWRESKCDGVLLLNLGRNVLSLCSGYDLEGQERAKFQQFVTKCRLTWDQIESSDRKCNNTKQSSATGLERHLDSARPGLRDVLLREPQGASRKALAAGCAFGQHRRLTKPQF